MPGLPGKATADFIASMDLPWDWLVYLHSLNSHVFSAFDQVAKVITFAVEYKHGLQDTAASHQLSLYLCSGQYQRRALGITTNLYGATIVNTTLTIYVSRWEEDNTIVCTLPLSTFISANNNKGVYPTSLKFSLATFPEFIRGYLFICKIADQATADITEVTNNWNTPGGQEHFKSMAREASLKPWQYFTDDPQEDQEDIQPEDWESFGEDTEDAHMVASMED